MPWGPINWLRYNCKHCPLPTKPWREQVRDTRSNRDAARYHPDINIQALEIEVVRNEIVGGVLRLFNGRSVYSDGDFSNVYMVCNRIIGASNGEETKIVYAYWHENSGDLHGRPMSYAELRDHLRRFHPDELGYFENWHRNS